MARDIYCRLHLKGTLVAQSPLHVGGYGDDVDTDLPLARDGAGQLYVPGTSLAGALRELTEQLWGFTWVEQFWGFQRGDVGQASLVVVEDGELENADCVAVEIRDHVGIDREYGSAAEHIKYDRAILPRGTKFCLQVTVEVPTQDHRSQALAMLATLQNLLESEELRLGAAKTRGLGKVQLLGGQITEERFATREGILSLLKGASAQVVPHQDLVAACQQHPPCKPRPRVRLEIHWRPVGPLMVKAAFEGMATDMLPLVSGCNGHVSLVLPGSSIKGALRSHAERIVRTMLNDTNPRWRTLDGKKRFLDAVEVPLVNELFGQRSKKIDGRKSQEQDRSYEVSDGPVDHTLECHSQTPDVMPGLGALRVMDCFATRKLDRVRWQRILAANSDEELIEALRVADLQRERDLNENQDEIWAPAYHVAIDRWLGSAAESMLYTVLEPHHTRWEPIVLELELRRLPENCQLASIALLFLVLRDLANDRLPLGFATHRGVGSVTIEQVKITGFDLPNTLSALQNITLSEGRLSELDAAFREQLNTACRNFIDDCAIKQNA